MAQVRAFAERAGHPGQFAAGGQQRVELVLVRQRRKRRHHARSSMAPLRPDRSAAVLETLRERGDSRTAAPPVLSDEERQARLRRAVERAPDYGMERLPPSG